MKQIVQSYRTGKLELSKVPTPVLEPGHVLVQIAFSTLSLGTKGSKVRTAQQSLLGKARSRPDLVQHMLNTARREGLLNTYRKVMNWLDERIPLSLQRHRNGHRCWCERGGVSRRRPGGLWRRRSARR